MYQKYRFSPHAIVMFFQRTLNCYYFLYKKEANNDILIQAKKIFDISQQNKSEKEYFLNWLLNNYSVEIDIPSEQEIEFNYRDSKRTFKTKKVFVNFPVLMIEHLFIIDIETNIVVTIELSFNTLFFNECNKTTNLLPGVINLLKGKDIYSNKEKIINKIDNKEYSISEEVLDMFFVNYINFQFQNNHKLFRQVLINDLFADQRDAFLIYSKGTFEEKISFFHKIISSYEFKFESQKDRELFENKEPFSIKYKSLALILNINIIEDKFHIEKVYSYICFEKDINHSIKSVFLKR